MNDLNVGIGRKVSELRERQRLTTVQLAGMVGVSQAQISRLENGKQGFRTSTLTRIAQALKVPTSYFLTEQDPAIATALEHPEFRAQVKEAADKFLADKAAVTPAPAS